MYKMSVTVTDWIRRRSNFEHARFAVLLTERPPPDEKMVFTSSAETHGSIGTNLWSFSLHSKALNESFVLVDLVDRPMMHGREVVYWECIARVNEVLEASFGYALDRTCSSNSKQKRWIKTS